MFSEIWEKLQKTNSMPSKYSGLITEDYDKCEKKIANNDRKYVSNLVESLFFGKVIILKQAFKKDFIDQLKIFVSEFWRNNPDTYFQMKEGCKDFHRVITPQIAKNYSLGAVRHSTYFFPWNASLGEFKEPIYKRWRLAKTIAGLQPNQYESNTPKDISIDRIQIVCYPPGYGGVEKHTDTDSNCNLAISCYLSSIKNGDFKSGGFYLVDHQNNKINLEKHIQSGDISIYCPTVEHGVDAIDADKKSAKDYDWYSVKGRWWMGLFSPDSNETNKRKTSVSLDSFHSEKISKKINQ